MESAIDPRERHLYSFPRTHTFAVQKGCLQGDQGLHPPEKLRRPSRGSTPRKLVKETLNANLSERNDGVRMLNQYMILSTLGSGSFGTVHHVRDADTGAQGVFQVAFAEEGTYFAHSARRTATPQTWLVQRRRIDHIHDELQRGNSLYLVRSEVAIMKKLTHENIINLIEVLDDPQGDSIYMVLELCQRGVLMKVGPDVVVEPYSEWDCRKYFRSLLLGIEYLHAQGISHRDVKPENLLLTSDGTLKISDFGVSEMFSKDNGDRMSKTTGSPAFMAPEFLSQRKTDVSGMRTDIWAMGVTLYCLYFGRLPFNHENVLDLYEAIRNTEPEIPSDTEEGLADLFRQILKKNPDERITMQELREHRWVTANGEEPLPTQEENDCVDPVQVTREDISSAIKGVRSVFTVLKAVNKLKQIGLNIKQRHSGDERSSGPRNHQRSASDGDQHDGISDFAWRALKDRGVLQDFDKWSDSLHDLGRPTAKVSDMLDHWSAAGLWSTRKHNDASSQDEIKKKDTEDEVVKVNGTVVGDGQTGAQQDRDHDGGDANMKSQQDAAAQMMADLSLPKSNPDEQPAGYVGLGPVSQKNGMGVSGPSIDGQPKYLVQPGEGDRYEASGDNLERVQVFESPSFEERNVFAEAWAEQVKEAEERRKADQQSVGEVFSNWKAEIARGLTPSNDEGRRKVETAHARARKGLLSFEESVHKAMSKVGQGSIRDHLPHHGSVEKIKSRVEDSRHVQKVVSKVDEYPPVQSFMSKVGDAKNTYLRDSRG